MSQVIGPVSFRPATLDQWGDVAPNYPLTSGDNLWTDRAARSEVQLGDAVVRLGSDTSLGVLNLDDRIAQFQVTQGSVALTIDNVSNDEMYEVDTPNGAVSILRPGFYRIDVNESGDVSSVTVRQGDADVTASDGQPIALHDNQSVTLLGLDHPRVDVSRVRQPDEFEDWCLWRDRSDREGLSARYVSPGTIGYSDLDQFGTWRNVDEYGPVWVPQVRNDWAPYREGRWVWTDDWGWTWVDDEPWGFAPFHYGRWVNMSGVWGWCPGTRVNRAIYAPALVAFIGSPGQEFAFSSDTIAWFPLGPDDRYVPPYNASASYVRAINMTSVRATNPAQATYANQAVRGAVTAIPRTTFVNAGPVAGATRNLPVADARQAHVAGTAPPVAPSAASLVGQSGAGVPVPPQAVVQRRVVARVAPPPRPVPFAAREPAMKEHPGSPVDSQTLGHLRAQTEPVATTPPVRIVAASPRPNEPARTSAPQPTASIEQRPGPPAHASEAPERREQTRVTPMPQSVRQPPPPPGPPQPARAQERPNPDQGQLAAQQAAERARLEAEHAAEQAQFEAQRAQQEHRAQDTRAQQQLQQREEQQKRELDQRQMRDHQQLQQQQQAERERQRQAAQPKPPQPKPPQARPKSEDKKPKG